MAMPQRCGQKNPEKKVLIVTLGVGRDKKKTPITQSVHLNRFNVTGHKIIYHEGEVWASLCSTINILHRQRSSGHDI